MSCVMEAQDTLAKYSPIFPNPLKKNTLCLLMLPNENHGELEKIVTFKIRKIYCPVLQTDPALTVLTLFI